MENNEQTSTRTYNPIRVDKVIMPLIRNIGFIGSIIMSIAYVATVTILIVGFKTQAELINNIIFATVSAGVGIVIMQLLKWQGVMFAKELPENVTVLREYYVTPIKDRKFKDMRSYWRSSLIKDILVKAVGIVLFSAGIIYISIEGSGDYGLLLLGFVNLLMFASFGLLALASAYEHFNEQHINHIKQLITEGKTSADKPKPTSTPPVKKKGGKQSGRSKQTAKAKNSVRGTSTVKRPEHSVK